MADASELPAVMGDTTAALGALLGTLGPLALGLTTAVNALGRLTSAMEQNAKAADRAGAALTKQAAAAEKAAQAAEDAYAKARSYGGGTPELAAAASKARAKADDLAAEAAKGVAAEAIGVGAAFSAVVTSVAAVVATSEQFVQALNPRLIEIFNTAFRNLQATIGVGFQPIFEAGIGLFRDLAVQVAPLFIALKPLVESVATLIAGQLSSSIGALVPVFAALVPVVALLFNLITPLLSVMSLFGTIVGAIVQVALIPLQIVATLLNAVLAPVVKLFSAFTEGLQLLIGTFSKIIGVLVDSFGALLTGLFGGLLEQTIKAVVDAFQTLVKWIVVSAYTLAKLAGLDDLAARLKKAFTNQSSLAQGPTSIKGLEQIGKDLALASVTAVSSGPKDASNADILNELNTIDASIKSLPDQIAKGIPGGETARDLKRVWDGEPGYRERAADSFLYGATLGLLGSKK